MLLTATESQFDVVGKAPLTSGIRPICLVSGGTIVCGGRFAMSNAWRDRVGAIYRDAEWLRRNYQSRGLSVPDLAHMAGCSSGTIYRWLRKHDIPVRDFDSDYKQGLYRDAEWLEQKYCQEKMTAREMADIANCSKSTIYNWLERYGIEKPEKMYDDAKWLKKQYCDKGLSSLEIAEKLNCGHKVILDKMAAFGIPRRKYCGYYPNARYRDKDWLHEKYWEQEMTTYEIAELEGCHAATISKWLNRFGIDTRDTKDIWKMGGYDGVFQSPSKPERALMAALDLMGVDYDFQYRPDGYSRPYDFYIPGANLLIECDGVFWHHSDWAEDQGFKKRDNEKTAWARRNGYQLIRVTDVEINRETAWAIVAHRIYPMVRGKNESAG